MGIQRDRIKFNVGGRIFETTATTLANAGRDSYFGAILDDDWNLFPDGNRKVHFIDRNPDCFAVLLDLLRTGDLSSSAAGTVSDRLLYREAAFYGLLPHVRAAKWGPFDPDRLRPSASVSGRAPGDGTAVRASPDGGCAVAHGSVVHLYDWTLHHRPPVSLSHRRVNDAGWASPETLAVSVCERPGGEAGSIGLFSAADGGAPRHVLGVSHAGGQRKSFAAGAMAFDPHGPALLAACKGRSDEYGVGVWDRHTGEQTDFFYEPPGWPLGDADRLQWVPHKGGLLVATLFPRKDDCYVCLLDFRQKSGMAWRWSDAGGGSRREEGEGRGGDGGGELGVRGERVRGLGIHRHEGRGEGEEEEEEG